MLRKLISKFRSEKNCKIPLYVTAPYHREDTYMLDYYFPYLTAQTTYKRVTKTEFRLDEVKTFPWNTATKEESE